MFGNYYASNRYGQLNMNRNSMNNEKKKVDGSTLKNIIKSKKGGIMKKIILVKFQGKQFKKRLQN